MAGETSPTTAEQVTPHISPTLLIGLGGSGKDVLLRIRRMFYERYGKRPDGSLGFPIVGYLALDTDPKAFDRLEGENPSDFVLRNIWFKQGGTPEAIACTLDARQVEDYFKYGEQKYPHIVRWLPPNLMKFGANGIVDGAGQNRLFGRLALFHHIPTIVNTLKERINQLVDDAKLPERREKWLGEMRNPVQVDPRRLDVIFVYSLAGGTGSGMFLDMSFLVRHIVERELSLPGVQPFFTHYAVLPESFIQEAAESRTTVQITPDQRRKIQENAFACLREMEYFSMKQVKSYDLAIPPAPGKGDEASATEPWFKIRWRLEPPIGEEVSIYSCPWNICYLVGGGNDSMGTACLSPPELYQMIADRIFLHFDGGRFSSKFRSVEANLAKIFGEATGKVRGADDVDEVLYTHRVSRRFSTLGLAQLYFDRERMRRAASYRLAWKLVAEWWLRQADRSPVDMPRLAREDLVGDAKGQAGVVTRTGLDGDRTIALNYAALRDRILLENPDADRQRTWFQVIDEERNRRTQEIDAGRHDEKPAAAIKPFLQEQLLRLNRERHTKGELGLAVRTFTRNRELLEPEIDARLRCLFRYRLEQLGLRGTLGLLEGYANLYKEELDRVERMARVTASAMPAWENRVQDAAQIPIAAYARTGVRLELTRALRQARDHLQKRFHHEAIPDIKVCLEQVQDRVAPGKKQTSYADHLRRFLDVLEAQSDSVTGAQHYLSRRFNELREPSWSRGRNIGLLDHLSDQQYDEKIRDLIVPRSRAAGLDMLEVGPELERRVLELLRTLKEKWQHVQGIGDVVLGLMPQGDLPHQQHVDEFARDLAEACEALLGGFGADTSALQVFNKEMSEKKVRLDCLRIYSGVFLKIDRSGDRQEIDTPAIKWLGIAKSKSESASGFRRELEQSGSGESLIGLEPFDIEDDTVVLYQEKAGIPLCYFQELDAMGKLYDTSDRQDQTHLDYPALRGRLPDIRRVNPERQKHLSACLELTLYGIMTGLLTFKRDREAGGRFWLENRDEYGGALPVPVGEKFEDVIHHLAEDRTDRAELETQLQEWFRKAAVKNDGQNLVLLWCATQDLVTLVRDRVAAQIAARQGPGASDKKEPTILRTLKERMLPAARKRVESLPKGRGWLDSDLDLFAILRDDTLEPEEKEQKLRMRADRLVGCFQEVSEELPIPVMVPKARLEEKGHPPPPRPPVPAPPVPVRPHHADMHPRPPVTPVLPDEDDEEHNGPFKRPTDYDD